MADAFIRGAEKAGHRAVKIYAADRKADCVACGGCYSSEDRPCCRNADFNEIAPVLLRADGIVFATPLYWYDFPGKLKCLIDNMYCFYAAGKDLSHKKAAILSCGEETGNYMMFDGLQRSFELICRVAGWSIADQIYIPGVLEVGAIQQTDGLQRSEALGGHFSDEHKKEADSIGLSFWLFCFYHLTMDATLLSGSWVSALRLRRKRL